jgi:hypothetical protein
LGFRKVPPFKGGGSGVVVFLIFPVVSFQSPPLALFSPIFQSSSPLPFFTPVVMSYRRPSIVEESQLQDFAAKGLRPPKAVAHWRAPPVEHEEPMPEDGKIMSFLTFHECGLGCPVHPFLLGLLHKWELELQHLNPNGVLHITGFVTLYEGFLGIDPHMSLFRAFFHGRWLTVKGDSKLVLVGGFSLQKRSRSAGYYPPYTPQI